MAPRALWIGLYCSVKALTLCRVATACDFGCVAAMRRVRNYCTATYGGPCVFINHSALGHYVRISANKTTVQPEAVAIQRRVLQFTWQTEG